MAAGIREVGLIIQVSNVAAGIREVGLIIQVSNVAALERLA